MEPAILFPAFGALLFAVFFVKFGVSPPLFLWLIFGSLLLLLSLIDCFQRRLPDGLLAAGVLNRLCFFFLTHEPAERLPGLLVCALSFSVPLLLLVLAMDRLLGKQTMGGGDIKLIFVLGLYFDQTQMLLLLFLACALALAGIIRDVVTGAGTKEARRFPFGPCLSMAAFFVALSGQPYI